MLHYLKGHPVVADLFDADLGVECRFPERADRIKKAFLPISLSPLSKCPMTSANIET